MPTPRSVLQDTEAHGPVLPELAGLTHQCHSPVLHPLTHHHLRAGAPASSSSQTILKVLKPVNLQNPKFNWDRKRRCISHRAAAQPPTPG